MGDTPRVPCHLLRRRHRKQQDIDVGGDDDDDEAVVVVACRKTRTTKVPVLLLVDSLDTPAAAASAVVVQKAEACLVSPHECSADGAVRYLVTTAAVAEEEEEWETVLEMIVDTKAVVAADSRHIHGDAGEEVHHSDTMADPLRDRTWFVVLAVADVESGTDFVALVIPFVPSSLQSFFPTLPCLVLNL